MNEPNVLILPKRKAWILKKGDWVFAGYFFFEDRTGGPCFSNILHDAWLFPSGQSAQDLVNADKELQGYTPHETTLEYEDQIRIN